MDSGSSERPDRAPLRSSVTEGVKIVIVGGFGAGKTTMVRSVSEIRPLNTEETMTQASIGVDHNAGTADKTTTTIAFDFGRISLNRQMVLYLFGAPGQERFRFLWERLFTGTLGAVVLVDTRRLEDSWHAIDLLESRRIPFIVARNNFPGPQHGLDAVREALTLSEGVPLIDCDARERESSKQVLIALVSHVYELSCAREVMS